MPSPFDTKEHGLQQLRVESYRGLVFATFSERAPSLYDYIGPQMRPGLDRIFHKPIVYLGCTRQYSKSKWKLYSENVRDPYHAPLLHAFFSSFNLLRAGMRRPATVLNSIMQVTGAGGALGIPGLYVTDDPGGVDANAKTGTLGIRIGLSWAKSHRFTTGQCPVMRYNRQLMMCILHDKVQIAKAVCRVAFVQKHAAPG